MDQIGDEAAAADYLKIPAATLRQWSYLRRGPAYVKVGRHVRYRRADLDRWISANLVDPTPGRDVVRDRTHGAGSGCDGGPSWRA